MPNTTLSTVHMNRLEHSAKNLFVCTIKIPSDIQSSLAILDSDLADFGISNFELTENIVALDIQENTNTNQYTCKVLLSNHVSNSNQILMEKILLKLRADEEDLYVDIKQLNRIGTVLKTIVFKIQIKELKNLLSFDYSSSDMNTIELVSYDIPFNELIINYA